MPAELDEATRRQIAVGDRARGLEKGIRQRVEAAAGQAGKRSPEIKTQSAGLRAQWGKPIRNNSKKQRELRAQVEQVKLDIEQAERAYDLNKPPN